MRDVLARLVAVGVAVALIVAAVALRDRIDGRPDPGDGTAGPTPDGPPVATVTLRCVDEVDAICDALVAADARVEAGGTTPGVGEVADLAAAGLDPATVWVTLAPLADMVDERRGRAGQAAVLPERRATAISSPLVLVGWEERLAVADATCEPLGWVCLGDLAGQPWSEIGGDATWGAVGPGHGDPRSSATALLATAQAVAARADTVDFSLRDLQRDDVRGWFTTLERSVPAGQSGAGSPLRQMLTFGRSTYDVVGTLEAEAADLLPRAGSRADGLVVRHVGPALEAQVVLAGDDAGAVALVADLIAGDDVRTATAAAGWRLDGRPTEAFADAPASDPDVGLPSAGALEALLGLHAEVVR